MAPRALRPKSYPGAPDSDPARDPQASKRRAVSSACIPCRKRKSKCDGGLPCCSTCIAVYRTECSYDADSDHRRKGALKRDLQSLQQQNDALDVIVASLRSLPEAESVALLKDLRSELNPDDLAASLRRNIRLPHSYAPQTLEADFAQQICPMPTGGPFDSVTHSPTTSRVPSLDGGQSSPTTTCSDGWFREPQDAEAVENLLNLYFCWVHPFYQLFSRDHFLHDMGCGRTDYCSALLVNAILAFACHYSDQPSARDDVNNSCTAGDAYFAEAKRLLSRVENPSLTTVQALGVMSARECSHGNDANAYQLAGRCFRMALELGLHSSMAGSGLGPSEVEVRKITFWGVFNLETASSVASGRLSQLPRATAYIQKPSVTERSESLTWRRYEDSGLAVSPSAEQPARPMLFVDHMSQLSELASDMVNTFYAPQERFTSRRLATIYQKYQVWYANLPDAFRLENTSLPHVLVLHMYYYTCVLHLFRPYIKLDLGSAGLYPHDTCTFCANEISALMSALRAMYGLRRVCLPVTSFVRSACTIHLLNLPMEAAATHLSQGIHDLQAMSVNHQFAAHCVHVIQSLAVKWEIPMPETAGLLSGYQSGSTTQAWPSPPSSSYSGNVIASQKMLENGMHLATRSASVADGMLHPSRSISHLQLAPSYHDGLTTPVTPITPITPVDGSQGQRVFWQPFSVPGTSSQPQTWCNPMYEPQVEGQAWPIGSEHLSQQHMPTSSMAMDATMGGTMAEGGAMENWIWQ